MFVQLVLSVLLYGCETWALTAAQLHNFEVWHRGCLRQILGLRWRDRVSDAALYERCGREDGDVVVPLEPIQAHWRRRMLRWLGHLGRMEDTRLAKQLLWCTWPGGVGRPGRSTPTLPAVYNEYLQTIDLGDERKKFQDRMEAESKSLFGFSWLNACADRDAWREMVG